MPDEAQATRLALPPAVRQWIAEHLLRDLPPDRIVARLRSSAPIAALAADATPDGMADGTAGGISKGSQNGMSDGMPDGTTDGTPDDPPDGMTSPPPDPITAALSRAVAEIAASPELTAARQASRRLRQVETIHRLGRALAETAADPEAIPRRPGLTAAQFYAEHYAGWRPVVVPGFAADWPARRWTPEGLAARFGSVEVAVTDDRERDPDYDMNTPRHTRRVSLAAFVERIRAVGTSNDCYMVAQNRVLEDPAMAPLMRDVPFDAAWFRPDRWRGCSALWLGPAGTVTPLHHDTCNIMFVQLYGRKRITLASPLETTLLDGARSMYAAVDPEGDAGAVRFRQVVLDPGDAVFLPVGWWHHVRALDVSISLALTNFCRANSFDWYRPGAVR